MPTYREKNVQSAFALAAEASKAVNEEDYERADVCANVSRAWSALAAVSSDEQVPERRR